MKTTLNFPQQKNGQIKSGTFAQWSVAQPSKIRNYETKGEWIGPEKISYY